MLYGDVLERLSLSSLFLYDCMGIRWVRGLGNRGGFIILELFRFGSMCIVVVITFF